ncbi:ATPdependent RNA helicase [Saguinus oedipus]|uniref:ATPdependent RNA helicase n=1 Tax=Saguinus oedipus TaxID=9490 RepID=A0ABQ9VM80_SAGOE|nr:ATPdependent RNA helicase [Saguinus oedipus]
MGFSAGTIAPNFHCPVPDYIKSTVETVVKIHQTEGDGDILAFLTGQEEVETVVSMLIEQARALARTGMKRHLRVLPMYAGLPSFEQMKVFERVSRSVRKVIVATNVAETSITISGIVYVIDCGFVKLRAYNPRTAIECLVVVPVSQASANQRAGRGGRSRSGKCYRLYTATPEEGPGMFAENLLHAGHGARAWRSGASNHGRWPQWPTVWWWRQTSKQIGKLLFPEEPPESVGLNRMPPAQTFHSFPDRLGLFLSLSSPTNNYTLLSSRTTEAFDQLPQSTVPEMQRSNLAPVILQLKALGIDNVLRFHFMSVLGKSGLFGVVETGLDKDCRLTEPLGMRIAEFPLNPMFAKMLLESGNFGCSQEILSIAAMMQIQNIFVVPLNQKSQAIRVHRKFAVEEGDHLTMLNVYEAFIKHNKNSQWCQEHFLNYKGLVRAATVREQLKKLLVKFQVPKKSSEGEKKLRQLDKTVFRLINGLRIRTKNSQKKKHAEENKCDPDPVLRCIVSGFFANAARFHSTGAYSVLSNNVGGQHKRFQASHSFETTFSVNQLTTTWQASRTPGHWLYYSIDEGLRHST